MRPGERRGDEGFTLIELVITIVILTIVMGALATGVITLLRTTAITTNRLVGSHDAELLTEWLTTDVQSASGAPDVGKYTNPGCADDGSLPPGGINVARLTWIDRATNTTYHAAYRIEQIRPGPPPAWQLVRYFCPQGQPSTHFPVVRALKDDTLCPDYPAATAAACVLTQTWPNFQLQITTVAGDEEYSFVATASGRSATSVADPNAPQVQSAVAFNTDGSGNAGRINRVVLTFDEALQPDYSAPLSRWTLHNAPNGATITAVAIANRAVTLTLSAGGSPITTTTTNFTIDLQSDPNGVRDGGGNAAGFTGLPVADGMAPVITKVVTTDSDYDQKIDQITITASEPIGPGQPNPQRFSVTPPPSWGFAAGQLEVAAVSVNNTTVVLDLTNNGPTPTPSDTAATGFTVAMQAYPDAVLDANGNFAAWPVTAVGDGVAPELLDITSQDVNQNGRLDHIVADFSEPLQSSTNTSQWSLSRPSGWFSAPTVSAVSVAGSQVTLAISSSGVPLDTAATGLRATLNQSSSGIRDAAGNQSSFANEPVADGMAPVLTGANLTFNRGVTAGLPEANDTMTARFSEALAPVATTSITVVLDLPAAASSATIDIPGFTDGAVDVGTTGYFSGDGHSASWPATVTVSGAIVTVTLTGDCTGTDCTYLTPGPGALMTLNLSPALVDAVGHPALSPSLTIQWF